jgi:hypothetical protein
MTVGPWLIHVGTSRGTATLWSSKPDTIFGQKPDMPAVLAVLPASGADRDLHIRAEVETSDAASIKAPRVTPPGCLAASAKPPCELRHGCASYCWVCCVRYATGNVHMVCY